MNQKINLEKPIFMYKLPPAYVSYSYDTESNDLVPIMRETHLSEFVISDADILENFSIFVREMYLVTSIMLCSFIFPNLVDALDSDFTKFGENKKYSPTETISENIPKNNNYSGGGSSSSNYNSIYLALMVLMSIIGHSNSSTKLEKIEPITLSTRQRVINFFYLNKNSIRNTTAVVGISTVGFFATKYLLKKINLTKLISKLFNSPIELIGTGIKLIPDSPEQISKIFEIQPDICSFLDNFKRLTIKIDRIKDRDINSVPNELCEEYYEYLNTFRRIILSLEDNFGQKDPSKLTIIEYCLHSYVTQFSSKEKRELYYRSPTGGQIQREHDFDHKILFKTFRTLKQLKDIICPK